MARTFTAASSEHLDLSLGASSALVAGSGLTLAAIIRPTSDQSAGAQRVIMQVGNVGSSAFVTMNRSANEAVRYASNATGGVDGTASTITTAKGWAFVAVSVVFGVSLDLYAYNYATDTWTQNSSGGASAPATPATAIYLGSQDGTSRFWDGDIAIAGAWASPLTTDQVHSLPFALDAWFAVQPNGLWLLDQASTSMLVNDLTGNGANQSSISGTSVSTSSVPVFSYGHPIIIGGDTTPGVTVNLPPATLTLTPGDLTATPGAVSVPLPTAEIELQPGTLTPTPGPVSITLPPALLALTAGTLAVVPGGITVTLPSGTITLAPGVLTARIGDAVSVGCITLTLADTATASLTLADTAKATLTIEEC